MTSAVLLDWTTSAYFIALLLLLAYAVLRRAAVGGAGMLLVRLGFACHTLAIGLRWHESYRLPGDVGHAPFANLYESVIFFAWAMVLFLVALDVKLRRRVLGLFMLPLTLGGMAWAQLFLDDAIEPLMPALQSHWLTYHVISCFLAYGAFATACCVSLMYLLKTASGAGRPARLARFLALLPDAATLDEVTYRVIAIGFPVWTVGIVTGSVWASYAWGSYWSWDPKETWSLIVWLIYAAFLHARLTRGWSGRRTAWLAIGGFAATLFCYLGVNLLLAGLHSYGG